MKRKTKKAKCNSTAFHEAIVNTEAFNHNDLLNLFLKDKDAAKIQDSNGNYSLCLLFRSRSDDLNDSIMINLIVELLHHYPNAICQKCWVNNATNPIHVLAEDDAHHLLFSVLLNKNESLLNMLDENSRTPLQLACLHKSIKTIETILKFNDVMVNNTDEFGRTALFCCPHGGSCQWKIVALLLKYPGIDYLAQHEGESAFQLFMKWVNHMKYKDTKNSKVFRVVRIFMNSPGIILLKNNFGENIGHDIVAWNNPDLLSALFSSNATNSLNFWEANKQGQTALHQVCGRIGSARSKEDTEGPNSESTPYLQCLNTILSKVDVITINKRDYNKGETALHYACHWENNVAIKALLQKQGIDLNIYNDNGNTPLFNTIFLSEYSYDNPFNEVIYRHHQRDIAWDVKLIRLLLDYNECLVLARNQSGNRILDLARNRLNMLTGNSMTGWHQHQISDMISGMRTIIGELEEYTTKARWKIFEYIRKRSLIN